MKLKLETLYEWGWEKTEYHDIEVCVIAGNTLKFLEKNSEEWRRIAIDTPNALYRDVEVIDD